MTYLIYFKTKRKQKVYQQKSSNCFQTEYLTKFLSNNYDILKSLLSASNVTSADIDLDLNKIAMERVLRVLWQPEKDTLKVILADK